METGRVIFMDTGGHTCVGQAACSAKRRCVRPVTPEARTGQAGGLAREWERRSGEGEGAGNARKDGGCVRAMVSPRKADISGQSRTWGVSCGAGGPIGAHGRAAHVTGGGMSKSPWCLRRAEGHSPAGEKPGALYGRVRFKFKNIFAFFRKVNGAGGGG